MKRERQPKIKKGMSMKTKIILSILGGLVAFGAVFACLLLTREQLNYAGARETISGINGTKDAIVVFLDNKPESSDFNDSEKKVIADFESALDKCENYMTSLEASNVMKDENFAAKFSDVKNEYEKIARLGRVWSDTKKLLDVTDDNLNEVKKSESKTLQVLAEELSEYRAEVANFVEKYGAEARGSSSIIEAYGKLQLIGEELEKKYSEISLDEIIGMSRDDILHFYAKIEELNNIIAEK